MTLNSRSCLHPCAGITGVRHHLAHLHRGLSVTLQTPQIAVVWKDSPRTEERRSF
ncbi:hypothetical protein LEMLEM_LOCUS20893 [Lemmus lemmus]